MSTESLHIAVPAPDGFVGAAANEYQLPECKSIDEHKEELDGLAERLGNLGHLSVEGCKRAAFAILGEDILDNAARERLRDVYAPLQEQLSPFKSTHILDGGIHR